MGMRETLEQVITKRIAQQNGYEINSREWVNLASQIEALSKVYCDMYKSDNDIAFKEWSTSEELTYKREHDEHEFELKTTELEIKNCTNELQDQELQYKREQAEREFEIREMELELQSRSTDISKLNAMFDKEKAIFGVLTALISAAVSVKTCSMAIQASENQLVKMTNFEQTGYYASNVSRKVPSIDPLRFIKK